MDQQATSLLSILKRPAAPSDAKLAALNALKSDIKHYRVPENAQATIFECIRIAITQQASASLAGAAFSTLGHLLKRLKIQDSSGVAIAQLSPRLYSVIVERLGDLREQIRTSASSALAEMWPFLAQDVEKIIREDAIGGSNARAKETGMLWVVKMHKDENMPFKSYVAPIVTSVEDADGTVRDAAKNALIELFKDAPDRAKLDLRRQLKAHQVRHAIETLILSQIGATDAPKHEPEPEMKSSVHAAPQVDHSTHSIRSVNSEPAQLPPQEIVPVEPLYVHSERELSDMFRDMTAHFEGKETEHNWVPRDKSVLKIRRLLTGNAPQDYHQAFMSGVKSVMDGVIKVSNSLRTTMSTNGCQLVQELAKTLGPALDHQVEILLQTFIKMSSNTKHIAAENGRTTTDSILQHCSYNVRNMQHIWAAAQEKNAQLRQCTPQWLSTVLRRQASYKTHFESSGGLELAEKCIRKGLDDANPKVKEAMRAVYWTFAKTWPEKADAIMNKLDPKSRTMLEKDNNNPNAAIFQSSSSVPSRTTTPAGRTALKDLMAEQRRAKSAARSTSDRPTSAMATTTPARNRREPSRTRATSRSRVDNRVPSNASTASAAPNSKSSLMSGPVRRPRKPEIQRPLTADPYASRRMLRPQTPSNESPGQSPPKGTGASRSSIPVSTPEGNHARPVRSRDASPVLARRAHANGRRLSSSRPTSKDDNQNPHFSMSMREDSLAHIAPTSEFEAQASPNTRSTQERSVPRGLLPAMGEEEEFATKVSHSRGSSRRLSHRAQSPDIHQSPLKAMFDAARAKLERPASSNSTQSPRHDQNVNPLTNAVPGTPPRRASPVRAPEVPVYEDPDQDADTEQQPNEAKVLSELPINENVRLQSPQSSASSASPESPTQITHTAMPRSSQERSEILRNRKLLASGIERIRARTLDAHGFRRVQDLAKSTADIWNGGEKYEELMSAVLEYLTAFSDDARLAQMSSVKAAGLKAQALGIVRALLTVHPKFARSWFERALVAVFHTRRQLNDSHNHILADLERTADDIVRLGPTRACIDATVGHLMQISDRSAELAEDESRAVAADASMALTYLSNLVSTAKTRKVTLEDARDVLAHTASLFLEYGDAEVRKTDVELACEVYGLFDDATDKFWQQFSDIEEGRKGLLTYYIARRARQDAS